MKLHRLNLDDFNRLADGTRLKARTRQLAQQVLVDGFSTTEVAARFGMTRQRVNLAVNVIENAYLKDEVSGLGWVTAQMELPERIALQLDELAQALKATTQREKLEKVAEMLTSTVREARKLLD